MNVDIQEHRELFLQYVHEFHDVPNAAPLRLKVQHTFRVLEHAERIVDSFQKTQNDVVCRAAVLAALYHDCGRFPQFRNYRTFLDAQSVNHAVLSCKTIRDRGFLKNEQPFVRHLTCCAVLLHNRYALPPLLQHQARFVTHIVRDADKLDIFRIMVGYLDQALPEKDAVLLHVQDDPDRWTPSIVNDVLAGRVSRYSDLHFVNDFRLLLGTWMTELVFDVTRKALAESGLMESVLAGLPDVPALRPALDTLYSQLERCRTS